MKKTMLFIVLITAIFHQNAETKTINLCVDQRNWYPFLYVTYKGQVLGIHLEIVVKALKSMGHNVVIKAYPRKQCINRVKINEVDGMLSLAYHPDLAAFCEFPPEAATSVRSEWRILQVDYMVVTHRSNAYRYRGTPRTLPNPIRIPSGETIASDLRQDGFRVDDGAKDDKRNFLKLLRDEDGVVITTSVMAERYVKELNISDQITIHAIPFKSQSYFLAFSNRNRLSAKEKEEIWREIIKWRKDYVFMLQIFSKY